MARTARGHAAAGGRAGLLRLYRVLPGLGRHLFFRQPVFRFVDAAIYPWLERSARARCRAVSQPTRGRCHCLPSAGRVRALERGVYVAVGRAPDSAARADFLERDDPQSIQHCAAADCRAFGELSFPSPRSYAPNRRPRHRRDEKAAYAVKLRARTADRLRRSHVLQTRSAMFDSILWKKKSPPIRTTPTPMADAAMAMPGGCPCPVSAQRNPSMTPAMGFNP